MGPVGADALLPTHSDHGIAVPFSMIICELPVAKVGHVPLAVGSIVGKLPLPPAVVPLELPLDPPPLPELLAPDPPELLELDV